MMIKGVITALVTPMLLDGSIDYPSLTSLLKKQMCAKVEGIVVCGSTGEFLLLTKTELVDLVNFIIKEVAGQIKIIVGLTCFNLSQTLSYMQHFAGLAIDAFMVVTPPYVGLCDNAVYQYFYYIHQAVSHSIILYNVPYRTGCTLSTTNIIKLSQLERVIAIKDAIIDFSRFNILFMNRGSDFALLTGEDNSFMPFIMSNGDGIISTLSNFLPYEMQQLYLLIRNNDIRAAMEINKRLLPFYKLLASGNNPLVIKRVLYLTNNISSSFSRVSEIVIPNLDEQILQLINDDNDINKSR